MAAGCLDTLGQAWQLPAAGDIRARLARLGDLDARLADCVHVA
jgi:hypothetical protein